MTTQERYEGVIAWFSEHMPAAESELHYENPFQLLVAVVLSAQCTDKRVNMTTPALFAAFPTPQAMAQASAEEIFPYIRSISYPNNKARHLASMARMLCEEFGGEVPTDLEQLQRLPGVGRKTANVLGAVLWQREVMPVDTHVFRVAERIGLTTRSKTPLQTELRLEKGFPGHLLPIAHHWLILHGRYVCTARAPKCDACGIAPWCRKHASDLRAAERGETAARTTGSRTSTTGSGPSAAGGHPARKSRGSRRGK
ncbi:MAG TPA: endonuclease III [Candidatus Alistipes faecigallinarum]|nr:endonuclease III [Candidatus Alistipes faecigallinarum]